MKVLSWNLNHRSVESPQWDYFRELNPDIALLQEANKIPTDILSNYEVAFECALNQSGDPVSYMKTGIAVKGKKLDSIDLFPKLLWAQKHEELFHGSVLARKVELTSGKILNVVSVHSPAWHIDISDVNENELKGIRLTKSKKVWIADLLSYSLSNINDDEDWIVAGDFNLCEMLDKRPPGPNAEYLERMEECGWHECLRGTSGKLTPTYISRTRAFQLDYMFVNKSFQLNLTNCYAENPELIFRQKMSDHLPVVGEINF